jgi:hypothetical protein
VRLEGAALGEGQAGAAAEPQHGGQVQEQQGGGGSDNAASRGGLSRDELTRLRLESLVGCLQTAAR